MKTKKRIIVIVFITIVISLLGITGLINFPRMGLWILESSPMEGTIFEQYPNYPAQIGFKIIMTIFVLLFLPAAVWSAIVLIEGISFLSYYISKESFASETQDYFYSFLEIEEGVRLRIVIKKSFLTLLFPFLLAGLILKYTGKVLFKILDPVIV
jgi:hypothetical protein